MPSTIQTLCCLLGFSSEDPPNGGPGAVWAADYLKSWESLKHPDLDLAQVVFVIAGCHGHGQEVAVAFPDEGAKKRFGGFFEKEGYPVHSLRSSVVG